MFEWLRRKLGLEADANRLKGFRNEIWDDYKTLKAETNLLHTSLQVQSVIIARLVAKVDPQYLRDPFDPTYHAESDRIGEEVIAKIRAEFTSSNPIPSQYP